jgi:hypothetical protein
MGWRNGKRGVGQDYKKKRVKYRDKDGNKTSFANQFVSKLTFPETI